MAVSQKKRLVASVLAAGVIGLGSPVLASGIAYAGVAGVAGAADDTQTSADQSADRDPFEDLIDGVLDVVDDAPDSPEVNDHEDKTGGNAVAGAISGEPVDDAAGQPADAVDPPQSDEAPVDAADTPDTPDTEPGDDSTSDVPGKDQDSQGASDSGNGTGVTSGDQGGTAAGDSGEASPAQAGQPEVANQNAAPASTTVVPEPQQKADGKKQDVAAKDGKLAHTGDHKVLMALGGLALVVTGAGALAFRMRRRQAEN